MREFAKVAIGGTLLGVIIIAVVIGFDDMARLLGVWR